MFRSTRSFLLPVLALAFFSPIASICLGDEPAAVTADDPQIPVEQLKLLLKPLRQAELAVEAEAWLDLLEAKVSEISAVQIGVKQRNREIEKAEELKAEAVAKVEAEPEQATSDAADVPEKVADAEAVAKEAEARVAKEQEAKTQALQDVNVLMEQRTALIDRVNVVLDAWEAKGGDAEEQRTYVSAVSGLVVDVEDASALWHAILGWLKSPEGGMRWVMNVVKFVATLIAFSIIAGIATRAVRRALQFHKGLSNLLREFAVTVVRRAIQIVGLMVAVTMLEVNIGPVLAVIGAAGFVVAFALQGTLSNFASGLMILFYRPFDVGDVVNAGGVSGTVVSMNLVSTDIKTFDNQRMIVPNNEIWGNVITNVTGLPTRRVDMKFGISYSDDIGKAIEVMSGILTSHEKVLKDPAPVIQLHELGDSSVNFIFRPWVNTPDYWAVYWDVTRAVKERFDANDISIPFPQRDVQVYQESSSATD